MGVREDDFHLNHRFVTSWLISPTLLAILRSLVALYAFFTLFFILGWQGTHAALKYRNNQEFGYFTVLTFWGIAFYYLFAAFHTLIYARSGRAPLDRWSRPLQALHSLFYSTIITFPFLVTIVYWAILFNGTWFTVTFEGYTNVSANPTDLIPGLNLTQISRHGLNSLFAILEVILPATNPSPWLHLPFLVLLLALYVGLAYVVRASQGFYVYDFLDPATGGSGRVAAYAFGILAAVIVIFVVVWLIVWVRRRFTGTGKKSRADTTRGRDVEMGRYNGHK